MEQSEEGHSDIVSSERVSRVCYASRISCSEHEDALELHQALPISDHNLNFASRPSAATAVDVCGRSLPNRRGLVDVANDFINDMPDDILAELVREMTWPQEHESLDKLTQDLIKGLPEDAVCSFNQEVTCMERSAENSSCHDLVQGSPHDLLEGSPAFQSGVVMGEVLDELIQDGFFTTFMHNRSSGKELLQDSEPEIVAPSVSTPSASTGPDSSDIASQEALHSDTSNLTGVDDVADSTTPPQATMVPQPTMVPQATMVQLAMHSGSARDEGANSVVASEFHKARQRSQPPISKSSAMVASPRMRPDARFPCRESTEKVGILAERQDPFAPVAPAFVRELTEQVYEVWQRECTELGSQLKPHRQKVRVPKQLKSRSTPPTRRQSALSPDDAAVLGALDDFKPLHNLMTGCV